MHCSCQEFNYKWYSCTVTDSSLKHSLQLKARQLILQIWSLLNFSCNPKSPSVLPKCLNVYNNVDKFHFSFGGGSMRDLKKKKCLGRHQGKNMLTIQNSIQVTDVTSFFPPLNFQWNSQVLNESVPNRTHKVTPPPVPSPPQPLAQQSEVPTPSILSAPYQLCQAFNLPGDIPVFPAWDRGKDKHASLCGKSLHTPTHSLIWPLFN